MALEKSYTILWDSVLDFNWKFGWKGLLNSENHEYLKYIQYVHWESGNEIKNMQKQGKISMIAYS